MHSAAPRALLMELYQAALTAVEGGRCVSVALSARPLEGPVWAVAIGKAASAMLAGAYAVLGERLQRSLLISKPGHLPVTSLPRCEVLAAAHPVPDATSLAAGQRLLDFLQSAPAASEVLVLLSGGASSLVEVLREGVSLDDLQGANRWLLANGVPIEQMNALRRRLSRIKGGGLCDYLHAPSLRALLISDVPGDDPALIGSGLLHTAASAADLPAGLPADLQVLLDKLGPLPPPQRAVVETTIVATLEQALQAIATVAAAQQQPLYRSQQRLSGDAVVAAQRIAETLLQGPPGVYLWGGETTVCLPQQPGQGGRCQQLALAAAQVLAGHHGVYLLAAGTDGNDGPGTAAGACVDGQTLVRGSLDGLDAATALRNADAGRFLEAAGDLLDTGPTGTNVTDVVIGMKIAIAPDI